MVVLYYLSMIITILCGYGATILFIAYYKKDEKMGKHFWIIFFIVFVIFIITAFCWGITRNYVLPFWAK